MSENPTRIDWPSRLSQILSENSVFPTDVTFQITEGSVVYDLKAHKNVLAIVSAVFANMFFVHNTTDMAAREIPIPHTTKPAFQIMIDAIYEIKLIEDSLKGKSVHEVFAVLYLVVKYEIPELVQAVQKCLSSFPLTDDTVVEVAADAMEFLETFQEDAQDLLILCAKFLKEKMTDAPSLLRFVAENQDQLVAVNKLQVLMHNIAPEAPTTCSNCQQTPCKNGAEIQADQFRVGLKVVWNPDQTQTYSTFRNQMTGKVSTLVNGIVGIDGGQARFYKVYQGIPVFLFSCQ